MVAESVMTPKQAKNWLSCDGHTLRDMTQAALLWLEQHRDHVNALNVFPVPDGDTGTNMLLTMRAAVKRIAESKDQHVGHVAEEISRGALMGARGNSGVILSQIWRGFARVVKEYPRFDAQLFAKGLRGAAETAYKGVITPVEGTILTIVRLAADAAEEAAQRSKDLAYVLQYTLERSRVALANTPEQLPILKQAGVVDSGGQGLVYIFEGMLRWLQGELDVNVSGGAAPGAAPVAPLPAQALARPQDGVIENPYDVQFILLGRNLNVEEVRARIDAMGDSTVVVGDAETIKVHVHVKDPGVPISYGVSLGAITDVVVENMQEQMETIIAGGAPAALTPPSPPAYANGLLPTAEPQLEPGQIGVVAIAPGAGLRAVLQDLGVTVLIDGGQTNNPSTEEIFQAIQDVPSDSVVILPNNKNIFLAAESARDLSPKNVIVVPTRTVPQGISAMVSYNPDGTLDEVAAAMRAAAQEVATAEITTAVRDVTIDGVEVHTGQVIGIVDGKLRTAGASLEAVLTDTLAALQIDERELLTLYYGADVSETAAAALVEQLESRYPDLTVELVNGGQPHYYYILGAE